MSKVSLNNDISSYFPSTLTYMRKDMIINTQTDFKNNLAQKLTLYILFTVIASFELSTPLPILYTLLRFRGRIVGTPRFLLNEKGPYNMTEQKSKEVP